MLLLASLNPRVRGEYRYFLHPSNAPVGHNICSGKIGGTVRSDLETTKKAHSGKLSMTELPKPPPSKGGFEVSIKGGDYVIHAITTNPPLRSG